MHHDVTIDRVLKKISICSEGLGFVLKVFNVSCYIRVPYLRSENNLGRLKLLSHLTVHIGATFCQYWNLTFGVRVID